MSRPDDFYALGGRACSIRATWSSELIIVCFAFLLAERLISDEDQPQRIAWWIDWVDPLPNCLGWVKTAVAIAVALAPFVAYFVGRARDRRHNMVPSDWFLL